MYHFRNTKSRKEEGFDQIQRTNVIQRDARPCSNRYCGVEMNMKTKHLTTVQAGYGYAKT